MAPKRKAEDNQKREEKRARPSSSEVFQDEKQTNPDELRRNVQICSHIALWREKGSYSHHMLVLQVDNNALKCIEYGSPAGMTNGVRSVIAQHLGKIQERNITFDEFFQPNASQVSILHHNDYPKTDENKNAAIQRAKSRLGEKRYCLTCNNCEHFVTWALTGKPISLQFKDAGAVRRMFGDAFATTVSEGLKNVNLLLKECLSKVLPETLSKYLSILKDKCLEYLPENTAFDRLKSHISSIQELDVLLFIAISSLKIVTFSLEGQYSPSEYILEIIKIVGLQISTLLFGTYPQLLDICDKIDLWRLNFISTGDLLREIFKIIVSYLVLLAAAICFPGYIHFLLAKFRGFSLTVVASSVAGLLFDIGHSILCAQ